MLSLWKKKESNVELPELPEEILVNIFQFLDEVSVVKCRLVNKSWKLAAESNTLWSLLAQKRWPTVQPSLRIRNWMRFYSNRYKEMQRLAPIECHPIENCYEFEFKCPLIMENLTSIDDQTLYCDQCQNVVKIVSTKEELEWECAQGNCVSFLEPTIKYNSTNETLKEELNCIVVGDTGVGKSTVIRRFYHSLATSQYGKVNLTPVKDKYVKIELFEPAVVMNIREPALTWEDLAPLRDGSLERLIADFPIECRTTQEILEERRVKTIQQANERSKLGAKLLGIEPDKINVILVCFSVVDYASYKHAIKEWAYIGHAALARNAKVVLVGLKADLRKPPGFINSFRSSQVEFEVARKYCQKRSLDYVEIQPGMDMYSCFQRITNIALTPKTRRLGGCVVV